VVARNDADLSEAFPDEEIPQMTLNAVPLDEMPVISDETPAPIEELPIVLEETPVLAEEATILAEEMPVEAEEAPADAPAEPTAAEVIALDNAAALEELLAEEIGFGSSLLENLTAENLDNIKIEGVENANEDSGKLSLEEISNELDYLLNMEEKDEDVSMDREDLESLPDINGIIADDTDADTPEPSALEVLFEENQLAEEIPAYTREQEFTETNYTTKGVSKKTLITAVAAVAILTGAAGIAALTKAKHNQVPPEAQIPPAPMSMQDENLPAEPALSSNVVSATPQELKETADSMKTTDGYLSVEKLVWEVPEQFSVNERFKSYLNTAGKSIKLSLTSDLLLATEFPIKNSVKVKVQLSSAGNVNSANVVSSSGSDEIDKIVLQSVKDTLGVLKPPSGVLKDTSSQLGIIISF
jgi:TonB family protein